MTVKEIIKNYLIKNGCDGLCAEECGCGLDDFMPCAFLYWESVCTNCIPAKRKIEKDGSIGYYPAEIDNIDND